MYIGLTRTGGEMTTEEMDPYYYARDHDRGPGAWCVYGPNGWKTIVGGQNTAYLLAKVLSGKIEEAESMAKYIRKYVEYRRSDDPITP